MRLLRIAVCVLILATFAAAQSTSSSTSQSNQNAPQQPGQAPQSPLADQPTSQQQQQQAQAEGQKPKTSTFDVSGATGSDQDQELGEVRLMSRYSQIGGTPQGRSRSFHNEGEDDLAEVNYFTDRRFYQSDYRLQFLSMFRATNDSSIDPEKNSIHKAYLRLFNARHEFVAGDALVNYSRLTFNQNVKGLTSANRIGNAWKLSTVAGVFIDRYGSLFKEQPDLNSTKCAPNITTPPPGFTVDPMCGRPFTSLVSGARLEYAFTRDSALGFNFSSSDDLTFSRRDQPFNTAPLPVANRVGSVDLKWQKGMFRMDSEFAYSATNFDIRGVNCIAPCDSRMPTPGLGLQGDWGGRFDASWRHHKWTFRTSYVRYQPTFTSINARQISDLQDFLFRVSYDVSDWLTVDGTMRRSNDDLKGQNNYEKTLWGPEGRLMFHDLGFYRKAVFEIGYRHRIVDGFNSTAMYNPIVDPVTNLTTGRAIVAGCVAQSAGPGMVCIDRFQRQPYVEMTLPVKTTFLTIGYERRQQIDRLVASGTTNTDRIYGGIRGIYDFAGWHVNPSIRYELERQNHRLDPDSYVLPASYAQYLNPIDLLLLEHDNNRLVTASMYVEAPRWFIVELQFRTATATDTTPGKLTQLCTTATTPPCPVPTALNPRPTMQASIPSPAGYSRPTYRANITYKIANDENKLFIVSFERNSNFYFSGPTDQNLAGYAPGGPLNPINFDERLLGVTFVYKFGKRAR